MSPLPLLGLLTVAGALTTIDNRQPRRTTTGEIVDGHDGRVQRFSPGGPYFYHALSYGLCTEPDGQGCNQTPDHCGFHLDHNVSVYTSPDLSQNSWTYVGNAIDVAGRPAGTMFRPDVVYNKKTALFVMWWNWVSPKGVYEGYATSTSPTPEGPYTLVEDVVTLTHSNATFHAGDFHFFVDDDETGYIIYCAEFYCWIDQLSSDYLQSAGTYETGLWSGPVGDLYFVEAPALFKRNGIYYALFDHCCCFCFQGSGIRVYTAPSPLGPWTVQAGLDDMACVLPVQEKAELSALATTGHVDAGGIITVVAASYGANCNASLGGDVTAAFAAVCNGQESCLYQVCICGANECEADAPKCVADPDLGCAKSLNVSWTCSSSGGSLYTFSVPAEANNAVVPLSCDGVVRPYVAPTAGQGCLYEGTRVSTTRSQQSSIAEVDTPNGKQLLWLGDRWQQAPDGVKGHEPQFWAPLVFDAAGVLQPMSWLDTFTIDII
jgi:hypothetical protein